MIIKCHPTIPAIHLFTTCYNSTVQWVASISSLFRQPPLHLHSGVQRRPALLHLQFPLHEFVHPQCERREQALLASTRVVQNGSHCLMCSSCSHHHLSKTGISWWQVVDCFQIKLAWSKDLLTHSKSAALEPLPFENRWCLASFKVAEPHVLLYISTANRSIHCMWTDSTVNDSGASISVIIVSVRAGVLFHTVHAVFFPQPRSWDVVSQHVRARNSGRAYDFEGPSCAWMLWTGISR